MKLNEMLERYRAPVERALEALLPPPDEDDPSAAVREAMRYSLLAGGKRIRPVLTLAFCELCGGKMEAATPFACAVEMVHTYSLIHDDLPCMDDDDLRRGKPTNHKVFGEDVAMLAGDGLLTLAFEAALSGKEPEVSAKAARVLARCAGAAKTGMVGGQCIDLKSEGSAVDLTLLQDMDLGKTVALISAACEMGVLAGHGSEAARLAAHEYAEGLGMAFQIRDDVLDVLGDAETLGKNVGMDAARDKRNYVSLLGLEGAQEMVETYTAAALKALLPFGEDAAFLRELAESLAGREH